MEPGATVSPEPEVWEDDAVARVWLRASVWTYHHPVRTCRMGPDPEAGAVVDPSGGVHGLEGARRGGSVVDDGHPWANTNLSMIMVAGRLVAALACWVHDPFSR